MHKVLHNLQIKMSRARWMSILSLFCLTYSAYNPGININLDGKTFQSNDTRWIQMTCLSNKITIGCTVEFLTNQRSYDHLRGVNNECYHSGGWCTEQLCTCSEDCKEFTLNITTLSEFSNTTFGCTVIVEVDNLKYKATTVIKTVQNGFELFNKEILPLHINNSVQETTTHPPPEVDSLIERIVLVIAICMGILCALSSITVVIHIVKCCGRNSNKGCLNGHEQNASHLPQQQEYQNNDTSEGIRTISYPKPELHTENSAVQDGFSFFELESTRVRDQLSFLEHESHTDSGISSISDARSRHITSDAGQLSSIGENDHLELETSWTDEPSFPDSFPFMILKPYQRVSSESDYGQIGDSTSRNTQSSYTCSSSSQETKSLFDRESIRDPWNRSNSCTILPYSDSDV